MTQPTCFLDDHPSVGLVAGAYVCLAHSQCVHCGKSLLNLEPVGCVCDKYGAYGHEERLYCSLSCMEAAHPDVDRDDQEEGE